MNTDQVQSQARFGGGGGEMRVVTESQILGNEAADVPDRVKRVCRLKERMMVLSVASLQVNWQMAVVETVVNGMVDFEGARLVLEKRQGSFCGPHHRRQMISNGWSTKFAITIING